MYTRSLHLTRPVTPADLQIDPISPRLLQLPSDACQEVGGSRRMSRAQCAGACGVTAGCQGFSFTCADLHLGSPYRCFVCSAADLGAASTSLEATSGVLTSQVRSSVTSLTTRELFCVHCHKHMGFSCLCLLDGLDALSVFQPD